MKKFLCVLAAAVLSVSVIAFTGCFGVGSTIEVTVNNTYDSMTDEQWKEYLDKVTSGDSSDGLQAAINGSLLSGVSIFTRFEYNDTAYKKSGSNGFKSDGTVNYHLIYCGAGVIVDIDKDNGDAYVVTNCHVVYDDSAVQSIPDVVYLYLYGADSDGVNYNITGEYCYKNGSMMYYEIDDGYYDNLVDYDIEINPAFCIPATVVGASVAYDIALLKISNSYVLKNSGAMKAEFDESDTSDTVYAGEKVYAVGNPEGDGMSATAGIISKESEYIWLNLSEAHPYDEEYFNQYRVIRTDAAINGGNSGGGLYNAEGQLVGIVNSKSVGEDVDNMGYALPGNCVRRLWELMREQENGSITRPGVTRAVFPAEYAVASASSHINLAGKAQIEETVIVTEDGGGLKAGDVIRHISIKNGGTVVDETDVTRAYQIADILLSARSGYTVTVDVERGGQTKQIDIKYSMLKG